MFTYLFVLLDVFLLFFVFSNFSDKKRIIVPLAESLSAFLCLYTVTSGLMWFFDVYSTEICISAVTFLIAVLFTVMYLKSARKGREFFELSGIKIDYRIIIERGAVFLAVLLSLGAYSTMEVGFNDGNAQAVALSLLNGNNSHIFEISEYENIQEDSEYEKYFIDTVSGIETEDFTAKYWIADSNSNKKGKEMWADYGCNPVYPSILALSALLFGNTRMAFVQVIFAFCLYVFIEEILKALKCDWTLRSLMVLLLGVSPIIVYCNHTTLVEPLLGFCMVIFVYYLLCKDSKLQVLSSAGVISFAFLHTGIYTVMPLFLIVYWMFYVHTRKIRHLISSVICTVGYILSFAFLETVAKENTSINYRLGLPFFKENYIIFVVILTVLTLLAVPVLILAFRKADSAKISAFERSKGQLIFKIGVSALCVLSIIFMTVNNIQNCDSYKNALNITFIAFLVCSGVIIMPYVIARLISTSYIAGIKEAVVIVSFVYTILLYSSVMKQSIDGYYYDARYLSTFIPFIMLAAGVMLRVIKGYAKYFVPAVAICILFIPHSYVLISNKTETRMDFDIYKEISEIVEEDADEDTVIFIEKDLMKYFYYPLLNKSEALVYPFESNMLNSFVVDTRDISSKVILISDNQEDDFNDAGVLKYSKDNRSNEVSEKDLSVAIGLPNYYSNTEEFRNIKITEFECLSDMIDSSGTKQLEMGDLNPTISHIEINKKGEAKVAISLTDNSKLLYNEDYFVSYHLEFDDSDMDDVFENQRKTVSPYIMGDYTFDIVLDDYETDKLTVIVDVVREGVNWYSWDKDVPSVTFEKDENGIWEYSEEMLSREK